MKIRPRYAKTLMTSHRRSQSASLRRANIYNAFVARMQYGRRPKRYYWHKAKVDLSFDELLVSLRKLSAIKNLNCDKIYF